MHINRIVVGLLVIGSMGGSPVLGSGSWGGGGSSGMEQGDRGKELFDQGSAEIKKGNYAEAEKIFKSAVRKSSKNPDYYNMLAYSQRQQGKLVEAFQNYDKALKLKPDFPEAREYLGEAYIQAAVEQLGILESYGQKGESEKKELVDALKSAASKY